MHVRKRGTKYRAEVRLADGRRISYTSSLRENAKRWARDRERERDMGLEYVDARLGRRTLLSDWYEQWLATLTVATSTRNTYQSAWRVHIEPYLGDRGVSSISRMDVQRWQADLERKHGEKKARVRGVALHVLSSMLQMACQSHTPAASGQSVSGGEGTAAGTGAGLRPVRDRGSEAAHRAG